MLGKPIAIGKYWEILGNIAKVRFCRAVYLRFTKTKPMTKFSKIYPYFKAFIGGKYIGDTDPSSEIFNIQPNDFTEITDFTINIPLSNATSLLQLFNRLKAGGEET